MKELRIGTFLAPNMKPVYEAIAASVGSRLGVPARLVVETDYENCANDLNDVCFVCSLPYVMFQRDGISPSAPVAAPVLSGSRYQGRPIYFSDVIVRRDSGIESFDQMSGRSWAYNEPMSHSGYGITRFHLVEIGETDGYFGEMIEAGFHETAIRMVADGRVDGSAIDSQVLEVEFHRHPELHDQIRVIDSLGPSTIQPVTITKRFDLDLRTAIQQVLLHLHEDPSMKEVMTRGLIERFVPVDDDSYDDIRMMVDVCDKAGFMQLR
ncbi:MAG TPA: PhnD/SsuA/transferrin family substrate-binding protein [Acidimicrobiia bacterium]